MALHNLIRESRIRDRDFSMCDEDANYNPMSSDNGSWHDDESGEPLIEDSNMNAFCDEIAAALFNGHWNVFESVQNVVCHVSDFNCYGTVIENLCSMCANSIVWIITFFCYNMRTCLKSCIVVWLEQLYGLV